MTSSPTAGWYPDPTRRHEYRYWEGNAWTDAVADAGSTSSDPLVAPPPPGAASDLPATTEDVVTEPVSTAPSDSNAGGAPPGIPTGPLESAAGSPTGPAASAGGPTVPAAPAPAPVPVPATGTAPPTPQQSWTPPARGPATPPSSPGAFPASTAPPAVVPPQSSGRPSATWWVLAAAIVVVLLLGSAASWFVWLRPGPGPGHLTASGVTSRSVSLTWSPPKTDSVPQRYVIRRNNHDIAEVTWGTTYQDSGLEPLKSYHYGVVAVVDGERSRTATVVAHTRPAPPVGLTTGEITRTSVILTWQAPRGPGPEKYIVRRDNRDLATVSGATLTYSVTGLEPLTVGMYTVVAVTRGKQSDLSNTVRAVTQPPPTDEARLVGAWDITTTVTNPGRIRLKAGSASHVTWRFTPTCADGPCPVTISGDIAGTAFSATLARQGGTYRGSAQARISTCGGKKNTNTLRFTIVVSDGDVYDDVQWIASKWKGSLRLEYPYTDLGRTYCAATAVDFSLAPLSWAP
jgi:hypothetical protein